LVDQNHFRAGSRSVFILTGRVVGGDIDS